VIPKVYGASCHVEECSLRPCPTSDRMLESQDFLGWVWIGGLEAERRTVVAEGGGGGAGGYTGNVRRRISVGVGVMVSSNLVGVLGYRESCPR
jgi:hypothetical protein